MSVPFDFEPVVQHGTIWLTVVNDGDSFDMNVNGATTRFEFDSNGSVTPGTVPITIGGSLAATAANIVAVLLPRYGADIFFIADGAAVDMFAVRPDIFFNVGTVVGASPSGCPIQAQHNITTVAAAMDREVFSSDVQRGKIVLQHGLDYLSFAYPILTAAGNGSVVTWTGTVHSLPGRVELLNGGASPYAAGNWFKVFFVGDKYNG